jgi:acetylornithine deacetylase/succinyl-diaminopimelate desuccinylase-like protein
MRLAHSWPALFAALFLFNAIPAAAQLSPSQPDPLAGIRAAAQSNTPACSATGESLCEQTAPKIIANAQGESPLAENLRRLQDKIDGRASGSPAEAQAVAWGVTAFRQAGVDVHTEKYKERAGGSEDQENVIAEIRGREKPDEWILLGAHLDSWPHGPGEAGNNCDAAMVIEAARDILLTGIRPRRSIRFVLFTGAEKGMPGSWMYVRSHRAELDRARAVIISRSRCARVTGYSLNGRHDIEPGLREAMKPIESLGAGHYRYDAALGTDNYDFLVEGVPTLTAIEGQAGDPLYSSAAAGTPDKLDKVDIADLKRNTAIAAVTAFGIAERVEPVGPRQSRAEIESLLKTSGLGQQMKIAGLWPLWESGERGRKP